ncbi:hypothetical protein JX265_001177 [Neoarthrinium moseri]|uniref:Nudix hydrolase domain-containing protein n=1 Tax=Neoarthrinium moseri TaxID=1658444 RepID=A0A9P9WX66_9PEZI|nr:uncharacterized protein JN550_007351 [Neoarthrinium moseri]KAI1848847.1 hypothetical protein JX266_005275 [Neoarthrinium moseri]KAI1866804.1 hypothetical protein JN550_007351 [Neoarthrinium moseri]KAI1880937.1 hypothetical protein JX265_001177 [Neoarthrinium moseri]
MASGQPIKKRAVAGTFLFRYPEGDPTRAEVALFRRSGKVRTYQHKLAPISGSVEEEDANPLATALREIKEETTLDLTSIELLRKGKPYSFTDDSIGREWTINPFAFRLKSIEEGGKGDGGITIDWEHEGWEWYDPFKINDSEEFGGVPKLLNSLRRVWPEFDLGSDAGNALTEGIESLRNDHESGARQLAAKSVLILRDVISKTDSTHLDDAWRTKIHMSAWHLWKNGRESMGAAIISALVTALDMVESIVQAGGTDQEKLTAVLKMLDEYLSQREGAVIRMRDSFVDYVRSSVLSSEKPPKSLSILTLSSSSTISSSLLASAAALDVDLDLRILESRPLCEGVTMAAKLLQEADLNDRVNVTLYSDASAALASLDVDILLFGADRISSEGDVSNKTGTLPAVLSTRHVSPQARVIVLSETEKIAGPGAMDEHIVEENDTAELTNTWKQTVKGADVIARHAAETEKAQRSVRVKNIYFEWVPAHLISAYITDEGPWSINDIRSKSEWVGKETVRFFDGL